ncbi:MAG TPA: hypothetical protein VGK59_03770 [Ohtaekwangia sp.]
MKRTMWGERMCRREMDGALRIFRLMQLLGENWYLGKFYSRHTLEKTIRELESALRKR